jgi:hypothetical protein
MPLVLARPPAWSASLGAYGGLGLHLAFGEATSQSFGGGELRGTLSHLELGAQAEVGELPGIYQNAFGGSVGLFLPIRGWVDVSSGLGLLYRQYFDCPQGSCSTNERFTTPAVVLRLGISDRAGGSLGVRLGTELRAAYDLQHKRVEWSIPPTEAFPDGITGVREFGGTSIALVVRMALDWTPIED